MAAFRGSCVFATLFFLVLISAVNCAPPRTVTTQLNYNCSESVPECNEGENGTFANLAYVKSVGANDILHYVFSTIGAPTVLMIKTHNKNNVELLVNWEKLMSNETDMFTDDSVTVTDPTQITYRYAIVFTRLHEYNDKADVADLGHYPMFNSTDRVTRQFTDFEWMKLKTDKKDPNAVIFNSTKWFNRTEMDKNHTSSLSFVFRTYGSNSRENELPNLIYNENVTQFDFTLDMLEPSFPKSRFALEATIFSAGNKNNEMTIDETESIDDEYTPGVFRIVNLQSQPKMAKTDSAFMQWKPVCYQSSDRQRSTATKTMKYQMTGIGDLSHILQQTVAFAHFGKPLLDDNNIRSRATNISFGLSQDGFYTKTNFTGWTATIGNGIPPEDAVSVLVIGVISAGLGIPVIVMILGGVYMCVKKQKEKGYRQLQDVSSSYPQVNS